MDSKGNIYRFATFEEKVAYVRAHGGELIELTEEQASDLEKLPREQRVKAHEQMMARAYNAHGDSSERNAAKRERKVRKR